MIRRLCTVIVLTTSLSGAAAVFAQADASSTASNGAANNQSMSTMPMHAQMSRMHEQMQAISEAATPEQRSKLMREHMLSMKDTMNMMHGMMAGHGMMSGQNMKQQSKHAHGDKSQESECTGANADMHSQGMKSNRMMAHGMMQRRMTMLEERLNAMQLLMDEMLKSQSSMLEGS